MIYEYPHPRWVAASVSKNPHPADCLLAFGDMLDWLKHNCTGVASTHYLTVDDSYSDTFSANFQRARTNLIGVRPTRGYRGYADSIQVRMNVEFEDEADAILFKLRWL